MTNSNFYQYNLSEEVQRAIALLGYNTPSQVQKQVIPALLDSRDIIVKSKTGSGKTAAFGIPITELTDWLENKPQALVLTPTRELAMQVREDIFNIGRFKRLKVAAVFGKSPFHIQEKELKQKTHVVVGTPGRIIDHIERGTIDLTNIRYLVIDEADEMLNMGFIEQVETIISSLPQKRTTVLLSATMPTDIELLCSKYMNNAVRIEIEEKNSTSNNIFQQRIQTNKSDKLQLLKDILTVENPDSCIVFCNTKQMTEALYAEMAKQKYSCSRLHGGMEQRDRQRVMEDFRQGRFRYLIATDVAARGIDIQDISLVINYDVPREAEDYVHRIGRTGRIGNTGKAVTFVTPDDDRLIGAIHEYISKEIEERLRPSDREVAISREAFEQKTAKRPELKEAKDVKLRKDIMKLHINAGKKTKMRAVDIVGTLCNLKGMSAEDIGVINILDVSTFVEILNGKGEMVFHQLQNTPVKGRLRKVSKVEDQR